jgi:peptide/nickel transport system ATP-binding protein
MSLLDVTELQMSYQSPSGSVRAVDGVSFSLAAGDTLGIVGESASGKTSLALSLLRLLPWNAHIVGGRILFSGRDILQMSAVELSEVRWKQIAMIFQGAMNALNPVFTVGHQLIDVLVTRAGLPRPVAARRAAEALEAVGIPARRLREYPHQFSGGMKQRIVIAMSLLCRPRLLIADEPTTALDVITQDDILRLIEGFQREFGMALIYISHDIAMLAHRCQRLAIMYAGQLVETGESQRVVTRPRHPYTRALLDAVPTLDGRRDVQPIPGDTPSLVDHARGCRFLPRCPRAQPVCHTPPPWVVEADDGGALCHFADDRGFLPALPHEHTA